MQTTKQLLAKLQGKQLIICNECKRVLDLETGLTDRQMDDDLWEIGLKCNCGAWYHSYFINADLKDNRPAKDADRKQRRAYQLKFQKFNKAMRKKFKMTKINGRWTDGRRTTDQEHKAAEDETSSSAAGITKGD